MNNKPEFPVLKTSRVFNACAYEMSEVYEFISEVLAFARASRNDTASLKMVADEIFTNIMSYAYEEGGDKWAELSMCLEGETVTMTFIDGGRAFDPLTVPAPDITLSAGEREIGGLGIHLVRSVMDDVSYLRDGDRNILTIRKKIKREA